MILRRSGLNQMRTRLPRRLMSTTTATSPALIVERIAVGKQEVPSTVTLSMNRPAARNSFNKALLGEFIKALDDIRFDSTVRAVIIKSANPGMFSAGADLKERATLKEHEVAAFVYGLRSLMTSVENLPMPTIAVVEGAALGGGLELALACDIRLAGSKAMLGLTETGLAIIPGAGGTQRLPRLIGTAKAKELIFRAKRLSAAEAHDFGIVNHVVPEEDLMKEALAICEEIAANGPIAVRLAKSAIHQGMQVDLCTGLEIERACYAQVIPTQDRLEGLKAFKEKRKPNYVGK